MKRFNTKKVAIALALLGGATLLGGCGSSNPAPGAPTPGAPAPNTAAAPVQTMPGMPAGGVCLSQAQLSQPIGFSSPTGMIDSINVRAGQIAADDPLAPNQNYGQFIVTPGGAAIVANTPGVYSAPNNKLTIAPDGSIAMSINPINSGALPTTPMGVMPGMTGVMTPTSGMTANIAGTVMISSVKQQAILSKLQAYMTPMPTMAMPGTMPVPQAVATNPAGCLAYIIGGYISLSHDGYALYGGHVGFYITLNNAQQYMAGYPGMTGVPTMPGMPMTTGMPVNGQFSNMPKIVLTW